jgi:kynurenine 3-monooxygenase
LALSVRGIEALKASGIAEGILKTLIPMKGRMIHALDGKLTSQPYGLYGECINSVDRKYMNEHLLSSAENLPNVTLHFEYAVQKCDFDKKTVTFEKKDGTPVKVHADLIIGTDGAYSKVRGQLMRHTRVDYSQQYIDHGYLELNIPPTATGEYAMDPNHLHIWPRHTFMLIALPNRDKSFTVTLFMPWSKFDVIKDDKSLLAFFEETFPDAVKLIGKDLLVKDYMRNPKGSLMTVKVCCNIINF